MTLPIVEGFVQADMNKCVRMSCIGESIRYRFRVTDRAAARFALAVVCGLIGILPAALVSGCSHPVKSSDSVAEVDLPAEYQIQPGDRLFVSVWGEEVLQQGVLVQPDGGLSFPLAGQIKAEGLSIAQLEKELNKRLSPYIPQPAVSVSLLETLGYRIYVVGRVNRPGEYTLNRPVDVLQALALAGGLTPFADEGSIKIFRGQSPEQKAFDFNYKQVAAGHNLGQNITLAPGDTVVVP